jgi:hypothetical protein
MTIPKRSESNYAKHAALLGRAERDQPIRADTMGGDQVPKSAPLDYDPHQHVPTPRGTAAQVFM